MTEGAQAGVDQEARAQLAENMADAQSRVQGEVRQRILNMWREAVAVV